MRIFRGGSGFWWLPVALGGIGTSLVMANGHVLHPLNLLWSIPFFFGGIMKLMDFDDELKP